MPDLQARIQVALFNILQESDIQIRGFKIRLPLDIQFVFTANPEDYTNRGSIVTPLKDRIDSQILTHYPRDMEISKQITSQESVITSDQQKTVKVNELLKDLIEQIAFHARESEYIDAKSGVSARLTISAYENLISTAERRRIINNDKKTDVRISDLYGVIPAITGKVELVYEGEQEGPFKVANILISKSIKSLFEVYFPTPDSIKKEGGRNLYSNVISWFNKGNQLDMLNNISDEEYEEVLTGVPGLKEIVIEKLPGAKKTEQLLFMEFLLHGLVEFSLLSKFKLERGVQFKDMLSSMFTMPSNDDDDDFNDIDPEDKYL